MKRLVRRAALAAVAALALAVPTASADAHTPCVGDCNYVQSVANGYGDPGLGIIDWWGQGYRWVIPQGMWTWRFTADVDGFYIGPGWCGNLYQSNDGINYGRYGVVRAGSFPTQYWRYNRVYLFPCSPLY